MSKQSRRNKRRDSKEQHKKKKNPLQNQKPTGSVEQKKENRFKNYIPYIMPYLGPKNNKDDPWFVYLQRNNLNRRKLTKFIRQNAHNLKKFLKYSPKQLSKIYPPKRLNKKLIKQNAPPSKIKLRKKNYIRCLKRFQKQIKKGLKYQQLKKFENLIYAYKLKKSNIWNHQKNWRSTQSRLELFNQMKSFIRLYKQKKEQEKELSVQQEKQVDKQIGEEDGQDNEWMILNRLDQQNNKTQSQFKSTGFNLFDDPSDPSFFSFENQISQQQNN